MAVLLSGSFSPGIIFIVIFSLFLSCYAQERCSQAKRAYSDLGYRTAGLPSHMTSGKKLNSFIIDIEVSVLLLSGFRRR